MKIADAAISLLAVTLPFALVSCTLSSLSLDGHSAHFQRRNPTGNFNNLYLASNYQNGSAAPGASSGDASGQNITIGGTGLGDVSQRPGCNTIFIGSADVGGAYTTGWTNTPELVGFQVDRNLTYGSATMPIYVEVNKNLRNIKRVIISQPGLPRDSWKYVNLFRNSLICAVSNASMAVTLDDVLIVAPIWLGSTDRSAGAGQSSDIFFGNASWSAGGNSQGPGSLAISTLQVMDDIISRFANTAQYPAVSSIIVAGHSLGASFAQRYAMARKTNSSTDPLVQYWVGNPGAYVWPSTQRPVTPSDTSCASTVDAWSYGVGAGLPSYFGSVASNVTAIYERYRARKIQYALGLSDNEVGDTHCEAQYQGSTHLSRGQNMENALKAMPGGLPATQTFNYVAGVAHEDYLMMSDPVSQEYLFVNGLSQARPGTSSSGSGSGSSSSSSGGSAGSSSGSGSSGTSSGGTSSGAIALSPQTALPFLAAIFSCSLTVIFLFA